MTELFGLIASVALLIWLLGRGAAPDLRWRRRAEALALALIALGILYALVRAILSFMV